MQLQTLIFAHVFFLLTCIGIASSSNQKECFKEELSASSASRRDHRGIMMRYALCLHQNGEAIQALDAYKELRKLHSNYAFPLTNIAYIYLRNGSPWKTIEVLEQYFNEVGEGHPSPLTNMIDEDSLIFGSPCNIKSIFREDCVAALNLLGVAQSNVHNHTRAMDAYSSAIEIGQGTAAVSDVFTNLGTLQYELGENVLARDSFLSAFLTQSGFIDPGPLIQCETVVPSVPISLEDSSRALQTFHSSLDALEVLIGQGGAGIRQEDYFRFLDKGQIETIQALPPLRKSASVLDALNHFHLHFYGFHDRHALERISLVMTQITNQQLMTVGDEIKHPLLTGIKRKKKLIVFVSCLIGGNEPHGQLIVDVIKRLPSRLFESSAIGIGATPPSNDFVSALTGKFYSAGNDREIARSILSSLRPDCVVFSENINNPIVHFLGYERWSPIQVLLMGAPVTGGIPSIDYFLSGDRLEHPFRTQASGDQIHLEPYTEQVVLFEGQSISFPKEQSHPRQDSLLAAGDAFGLPFYNIVNTNNTIYDEHNVPLVEGSIYMCFQSLFKIQPIFDSVIVKILHGDPTGHAVLQAARTNHKTDTIKDRLKKYVVSTVCRDDEVCLTAQEILSRIHFIPRVKSNRVAEIIMRATVILQPFPFDGSKTASDILGIGVPLVTFPQRYLKGRLASTFYSTLALHDIDPGVDSSICCVASDVGDYISKVLRLGVDSDYRNRVASAISIRKHRIFNDAETSYEWARFLSRAMGVSINDEDLAIEMNYVPEEWQTTDYHSLIMVNQQRRWKRAKLEDFMQSQ